MRLLLLCLVNLVTIFPLAASDFHVEKQKLKLSLEYENFVGIQGSEITTSGLRASYLMKAGGSLAKKVLVNIDFQTGAKTNFYRHFSSGDLSPLIWSNRWNATVTIPVNSFFFGGNFYFRNKWLAHVPENQEFVDIFGGEGFREITGGVHAGYSVSPNWQVSADLQKSDLNFAEFPLSNSNWVGGSLRVTRKLNDARLNFDYRIRNVDFTRPVLTEPPPIISPVQITPGSELQHDRFWEIGGNLEVLGNLYFSAGYSFQNNDSNNPGFSYRNHRVDLLIGTELTHKFHLQAYGIVQRQTFPGQDGFLNFPVLLDENDNNTMAASLVKIIGEKKEIELGFQRLTHNSAFPQLDASKYVLYLAYNYRF